MPPPAARSVSVMLTLPYQEMALTGLIQQFNFLPFQQVILFLLAFAGVAVIALFAGFVGHAFRTFLDIRILGQGGATRQQRGQQG